jgi:hypothetical protein
LQERSRIVVLFHVSGFYFKTAFYSKALSPLRTDSLFTITEGQPLDNSKLDDRSAGLERLENSPADA